MKTAIANCPNITIYIFILLCKTERLIRFSVLLIFTSFLSFQVAWPQNDSDGVYDLELGKEVVKPIKPNTPHYHVFKLKKGSAAYLEVEEKGINLYLGVAKVSDNQIVGYSNFGAGNAKELVVIVAESDEEYALIVNTKKSFKVEKPQADGRYLLRSVHKDVATEKEEQFVAALGVMRKSVEARLNGKAKDLMELAIQLDSTASRLGQLNERYWQASSLGLYGGLLYDIGKFEESILRHSQALELWLAMGNNLGAASAINNIGVAQSELGKDDEALKSYEKALLTLGTSNDDEVKGSILNNKAVFLLDAERFAEALGTLQLAEPIWSRINSIVGEATAAHNLGRCYYELNEKRLAVNFLEKARGLWKELDYSRGYAKTLNSLGMIYADLGLSSEALDAYILAASIWTDLDANEDKSDTLNNIGSMYYFAQDYRNATKFFQASLDVRRNVEGFRGTARTLKNLGLVSFKEKSYEKAKDYLGRALFQSRLENDKRAEVEALINLMALSETTENRKLAIFYGKLAMRKLQILRFNTKGESIEHQKTFLQAFKSHYQSLAELLIREKQFDQAVEVLNLYSDQQLLDANNISDLETALVTLSKREEKYLKHYESVLERVVTNPSAIGESKSEVLSSDPVEPKSPKLNQAESSMQTLEIEFFTILKDAQSAFSRPRSAEDQIQKIELLEDIGNTFRNQAYQKKQNQIAIYTLIGEKEFHLLLVANNGVKNFSIPITGAELNRKAREFAISIKQLDSVSGIPKIDMTTQAKELYEIVFKPIENYIPREGATILWNLDGNLRYVPINALHDENDYLIRRNISNIIITRFDTKQLLKPLNPIWKASVFAVTESQNKVKNLGAEYDFPSLNSSESNLKTMFMNRFDKRSDFSGGVLLNGNFTRDSMLIELRKKNPVVHVSSHFRIQPGNLARSFLVLGDGSAFSLFDMNNIAWRTFPKGKLFEGVDLLTLAACDTGTAEPDADGKEVDSFAEIAQRFGAASVMSTLWSVNDCSTTEFMKLFYGNKINGNMNKAEAIRKAQLAMLDGKLKLASECNKIRGDKPGSDVPTPIDAKQNNTYKAFRFNSKKPFAHPYYWAPFILYGNWN